MDKQIKKIETEVKHLEKLDHKRDKVCTAGKKMLDAKKKYKK